MKKQNKNTFDYDTYNDDGDSEFSGFAFNKLNINNDDYYSSSSPAIDLDFDSDAYYSHEMNILKQKSKFTKFVQNIYIQVKNDIEELLLINDENSTIKILNLRYSPKLAESFINNLSYNIPLWTKIMHQKDEANSQIFTLNERFSLLKSLLAHEKDSLDIFLNRLFNELLNELFLNSTFLDTYLKNDIKASNAIE